MNWQVNSISNFTSFFIIITHNFPLSFKLIHFPFYIKRIQWKSQLENFMCSSENLPNSSCHFQNHKSAFLQILHHTLLSWNIAPVYFFSSSIIYFGQKQLIKVQIFVTFKFSSQNSLNSLCQFWNGKSIPLQIFHHSSVSLLITPL